MVFDLFVFSRSFSRMVVDQKQQDQTPLHKSTKNKEIKHLSTQEREVFDLFVFGRFVFGRATMISAAGGTLVHPSSMK